MLRSASGLALVLLFAGCTPAPTVGGTIRGTVVLSDGAEPSGVLVGLSGLRGEVAVSDATGAFAFERLPDGAFLVTVQSLDVRERGRPVATLVEDGGTTTLEPLTLTPVGSVSGTVRRAAGEDHGGLSVRVVEHGLVAYSTVNGAFAIDDVPAGNVTLAFGGPDVVGQLSPPVVVKRGARTVVDVVTLALRPPSVADLEGHASVFGSDNRAGITVRVEPGGMTTTTDETGRFAFSGLPASLLSLHFERDSMLATLPAVFALPGTKGVLIDGTTYPIDGVQLVGGRRVAGLVSATFLWTAPGGDRALFMEDEGSCQVVSLETNAVVQTLVGPPQAYFLSPDRTRDVVVTADGSYQRKVYASVSGAPYEVVHSFESDGIAFIEGTGERAVVAHFRNGLPKLEVLDFDGESFSLDGLASTPGRLLDGHTLLYNGLVNEDDPTTYPIGALNLATGTQTLLHPRASSLPVPSPDRSHVFAMTREEGEEGMTLVRIPMTGGEATVLASGIATDIGGCSFPYHELSGTAFYVSPTKDRAIFVKRLPDETQLHAVDLATGQVSVVGVTPGAANCFGFSPNGAQAVVHTQRGDGGHIHMVTLPTGTLRDVLTIPGPGIQGRQFSPDGTRYVIALQRGEVREHWTGTFASGMARLFSTEACTVPTFLAGGASLLYSGCPDSTGWALKVQPFASGPSVTLDTGVVPTGEVPSIAANGELVYVAGVAPNASPPIGELRAIPLTGGTPRVLATHVEATPAGGEWDLSPDKTRVRVMADKRIDGTSRGGIYSVDVVTGAHFPVLDEGWNAQWIDANRLAAARPTAVAPHRYRVGTYIATVPAQ